MKNLLLIGLLTFASSANASPTFQKYECVSTAQFFEGNNLMKEDDQTTVVDSYSGIQFFVHTYNNNKIYTAIEISISSKIGSNVWSSGVWYAQIAESQKPWLVISESDFLSIDANLPEQFGLTTKTAEVDIYTKALLSVVCYEKTSSI